MELKEVYFDQYCPKCKHAKSEEEKEPCDECLAIGGRIDSHKPEYFEES